MAIPIRREGEYAVFTGADGKEIRYPIAELRAALRKKPAEREITCPDINKFNQFYANIIREPDPQYTAWMWEIFKCIRTREVGFRTKQTTTRFENIGKPYFLKEGLRKRLAMGEPFSFFMSSAYVQHSIRGQSADLKDNRTIYGFDLFVDIDAETLAEAHIEAAKIADMCSSLGYEHSITFSGKKDSTWF